MNIEKIKRKGFSEFKAYVPGWQPPDIETWIKLNTNESPYAPPKEVLEEIKKAVNSSLRLYPDPSARELRELVVKVILTPLNLKLGPDNVVVGLGSDEILDLLMRAFIDPGDGVAFFRLSYGMYDVLARVYSANRMVMDLDENFRIPSNFAFPAAKLLVICSPNNPNGKSFSNEDISRLCRDFPGLVVVDEAYADFATSTALPLLNQFPNLVVLRTFSKSYSLAGERIGILVASKDITDALNTVRLPFNMTRLNQIAACASLRHFDKAKVQIQKIVEERERLAREIPRRCPRLKVLPSDANFLLVQCPSPKYAKTIMDGLTKRKILIRYFEKAGLESYVRITVGTPEQNDVVLSSLGEIAKTTSS